VSTDAEVIRESMNRPALFAELYDRHHAVIHRFVARRVDRDVADDLASETFLVAFEQRQRFDLRQEDALPWLYGIVTNLLHRHRRREARAWKAVQASGGEPWGVIEDGPLEAALTVRRIAQAVRRMPVRDRDALLLYAWGDLDYEGVAQALGVPVGTVRSRLNRARRTLRIAIGQDMAGEVDHERNHPAALTAKRR
jgi:RNA polymerase sigma factor (sigma-70 family)